MSGVGVRPGEKAARRPQLRSIPLREAILDVASEYDRLTIRQLFYQLVSRGEIEKTESAYRKVQDAAVQLRLSGRLDYHKIADGHRMRRHANSWSGLSDILLTVREQYRRDYWAAQPKHVEVWCEKDALSGIIEPVCDLYGVPYVATRGFPSLTLLHESAAAMAQLGKPTIVFYFGDHDASGQGISDILQPRLRQLGSDVEIEVQRMALNPDQVVSYQLLTRPGKRSDSRHQGFSERYGDASVELDALRPDVLGNMVEQAIQSAVNWEDWKRMEQIESAERQTLDLMLTTIDRDFDLGMEVS